MISQIRMRFEFNEKRGLMKSESRHGTYDKTAHAIWVLITFWGPQNLVKGSGLSMVACDFKRMIWNQVYPYFTEKGTAEFEQLIIPILEQTSSDR